MLLSEDLFLSHRLRPVDFGTLQSFSCEGRVVLQSNHTLISTNSKRMSKKEETAEIHQGSPSSVYLPAMMLLRWLGEYTTIRGQRCLTSGPNYQKCKKQQHIMLFLSIILHPLVLLGISSMHACDSGCLMS